MREVQVPYVRRLAVRLLVIAATVVTLAVIGPFGTFTDMSLAGRLAYWGCLIGIGFAVFEGLAVAGVPAALRLRWPWPLVVGGLSLTVSVVLTALVAVIEKQVRGNDFLSPAGLAELYLYVAVLTVLVAAIPVWVELRGRGLVGAPPPAEGDVAPQEAPPPVPDSFLGRLPDKLGRDLLALKMEDHYLRVYTAAGDDLVLLRLRDAVAELEAVDGLQVHRSYWVAAKAVLAVERDRHGKMTLVLSNDLRVPVSRTYAPAVRAAGWGDQTGGTSSPASKEVSAASSAAQAGRATERDS